MASIIEGTLRVSDWSRALHLHRLHPPQPPLSFADRLSLLVFWYASIVNHTLSHNKTVFFGNGKDPAIGFALIRRVVAGCVRRVIGSCKAPGQITQRTNVPIPQSLVQRGGLV